MPRKHTLLCHSGAQVHYHHWHIIGTIHQHTPSLWHKDNIKAIWERSILFWHNQLVFWQIPNYRLQLYQHRREQHVMLLQTGNQISGRSDSNSATCRMAVYIDPKKSVQRNQIRNCPITTDDIIRAEAIYAPQIRIIKGKSIIRIPEHHKTTPRTPLTPYHSQTPPQCRTSHNFSL